MRKRYYNHYVKTVNVACWLMLTLFSSAYAADSQLTPDIASARCKQVYAKYDNVRNIASDLRDQLIIMSCIEMGIDPPLRARSDFGLQPAASVGYDRIPSAMCPPLQSCYTTSRSSEGSVEITSYRQSNLGGAPLPNPNTGLSAPEFTGKPNPKPTHLQGGGTVYFYDGITVTAPCQSLIYSDSFTNEYSNCNAKNMGGDAHVALPPPSPPGNIMSSQPIVMGQDATLNFIDGGIVVLPDGFVGIINGKPVKGGDVIIINHAGDMRMPAGTKLYPFPDGYLGSKGTEYGWSGWEEYKGPDLILPPNPAMVIEATRDTCNTRCAEPVPGINWF